MRTIVGSEGTDMAVHTVSGFDAILGLTRDLVLMLDDHGRIREASQSWMDELGWGPDELRGREYAEFVHPADLARSTIEFARVLGGDIPFEFAHRWRVRTGGWRTLEWRAMADLESGVVCAVAHPYQAPEPRSGSPTVLLAEEDGRNPSGMLDLLQRVSHEFRTPLHAVLGFTGLVLEDDATLPLAHRRRLERAQGNARELVDSVDDILEWAALESGERPATSGATDLHELVAAAFARMAPDAAQRGVALLAEVSRGLPPVATDPARLSRVVRHMLRVALRSTQKGRVVVRVATDPVTGMPGSLSVDDLGPAFPGPVWAATGSAPDAHAFGPGIGLLVTRALCDRLGHSLRLAPNPASAMIASIRFNRGAGRAWA